jgi:hypothetical protein
MLRNRGDWQRGEANQLPKFQGLLNLLE